MNTQSLPPLIPSLPVPGLIILASAVLFSGCATRHQFAVEAVRDPAQQVRAGAYRLTVDAAAPLDAQERSARAQVLQDVRTALSSHGLFEAPVGVDPVLEIVVDLRLEGPFQETRSHVEPVYLNQPAAAPGRALGARGSAGVASEPRKVGERTVERVTTVYRKSLRLSAYALDTARRIDREAPPVWSVEVRNEDESVDLSRYARLMAAAAMDLIGRDLGTVREVVVTEGDARVRFLARGIAPTT